MKLLMYLRDFNMASIVVRLGLSFVCGFLLGLEPERKKRPAGLRTHILVCLGSATASMTGFYAYYVLTASTDPLRIAAQVISGIGFLGIGTILVTDRSHVLGLTTAAGLWTSAAVGLALGAGFYEGALLCTAFAFLTIALLYHFEDEKARAANTIEIYLEISGLHQVNLVIATLDDPKYGIDNIHIKPARSGIMDNLGVEATMTLGSARKREMLERVEQIEHIAFAIESA